VKDFKEFLLRGNLVDVAVGIVIGVAFAALIAAFVADLISSHFLYGAFINALISFLIIAAVIFFLVVKPVNALMARRRTETPVDVPTRECPQCLSEIPEAARRCAFCTSEVAPA